jgi:tetrapyrrole methylase family protein / MazG family protein
MVACSGKCTKPDNTLQQSYLVGQELKVNCFFHAKLKNSVDFSIPPSFKSRSFSRLKPNTNHFMANNNTEIQTLVDTIETLRGDKGCPWDKKQTCFSLSEYLVSETTELLAAIDNHDTNNICEELGDVLYILIMIAEIKREKGSFDFSDVIRGINSKLIRRHPHVFAGQSYENEEQLAAQWQAIKAMEKK